MGTTALAQQDFIRDLMRRVRTAVIVLPVLVFIALQIPSGVALIAAAGGMGAMWELDSITSPTAGRRAWLALGTGVAVFLVTMVSISPAHAFGLVLTQGGAISVLMRPWNHGVAWSRAAGLFYIVPGLAALVLLSGAGPAWLLAALLVTWIGDTGAYLVGKTIGRRKLAPTTSPNKTVEGAIGGAVVAAVATAALAPALGISVTMALAIGLSANALGQVGDLFESSIKRRAGVKDSGRIIYGYGGMLDKVDSLLFAAPWLLLCQQLAQ